MLIVSSCYKSTACAREDKSYFRIFVRLITLLLNFTLRPNGEGPRASSDRREGTARGARGSGGTTFRTRNARKRRSSLGEELEVEAGRDHAREEDLGNAMVRETGILDGHLAADEAKHRVEGVKNAGGDEHGEGDVEPPARWA